MNGITRPEILIFKETFRLYQRINPSDKRKVDDAGNETLAPARFLDWPSSGNKAGVEAGYRALIVWAMQDAHQLSLKLGNTSDAQLCLDIINRMKKRYYLTTI